MKNKRQHFSNIQIVYEDGQCILKVIDCDEKWSGCLSCKATNSAGAAFTACNIAIHGKKT
jgi:hypothetical protein